MISIVCNQSERKSLKSQFDCACVTCWITIKHYVPGIIIWYDTVKDESSGAPCVTKAKEPVPVQVTFYTKAGCHLCEEARDMLDDIAALTTYELTEIDIRSNPAIFEKYRYRIPVIIINSETLLEGRIEFRDLAKAFHLR